jgi:hypothetical protein
MDFLGDDFRGTVLLPHPLRTCIAQNFELHMESKKISVILMGLNIFYVFTEGFCTFRICRRCSLPTPSTPTYSERQYVF